MTLSKRLIDIPFQRGQDESIDPKLLPRGVFASVENAEHDKSGRLTTVQGFTPDTSPGTGSIERIAPFGDSGRYYFADLYDTRTQPFHVISEPTTVGSDARVVGTQQLFSEARVTRQVGERNAQHVGYAVTAAGYRGVLVSTTSDTLVLYVYGDYGQTGVVTLDSSQDNQHPKIAAVGETFYVVCSGSSNTKLYTVTNITSSVPTSNSTDISAQVAAATQIEMCANRDSGGTVYVCVAYDNANASVAIFNGDTRAHLGTATVTTTPIDGVDVAHDLDQLDGTGDVVIAWSVSGGTLEAREVDVSAQSIGASNSVGLGVEGRVHLSPREQSTIAAVVHDSDAYPSTAGAPANLSRCRWSVNWTGGVSFIGLAPASKPFPQAELPSPGTTREHYIWASTSSISSSTLSLVLVSDGGTTCARALPGRAVATTRCPHVSQADRWALAAMSRSTSRTNVAVELDVVRDIERGLPVPTASELHLAGGVPFQITDNDAWPHGFDQAPPAELETATAGALTGIYKWAVVYVRDDAAGNEWESQPTFLGPATLSSNTQPIAIAVPNNGQAELVRVYRTDAGGNTYRRVADVDVTATSNYVQFSDNTVSGLNRFLYTTGGVLEADPPPSMRHLAYHGQRLFGINGTELWWTKLKAPGEGWAWSWAQVRDFGQTLTALASLDDTLVVFAADNAWAVTGDGPNRQGVGDWVVRDLPDVGCISPASVLVTQDGVYYQSRRGIEVMDRGLVPVVVSDPVEDQITTVTGTAHVRSERRCYFFQAPAGFTSAASVGKTLVWDYSEQAWGVESTGGANGAVVDGTLQIALVGTGRGTIERRSATADVTATIETGRVQLGRAVNGLGRIYSTTIMGDGPSTYRSWTAATDTTTTVSPAVISANVTLTGDENAILVLVAGAGVDVAAPTFISGDEELLFNVTNGDHRHIAYVSRGISGAVSASWLVAADALCLATIPLVTPGITGFDTEYTAAGTSVTAAPNAKGRHFLLASGDSSGALSVAGSTSVVTATNGNYQALIGYGPTTVDTAALASSGELMLSAIGIENGDGVLKVSTSYDDGATYQYERTYGVSAGESVRYRYNHPRQKVDGFRHRLVMSGQPMSLQSMTLEVGSIQGPTRVRGSRRK